MKKLSNIISIVLSVVILTLSFPFTVLNRTDPQDEGEAICEDLGGLKVDLLSNSVGGFETYTENDMTFRWKVQSSNAPDGTACTLMQGMYVGTTYVYTAKTNDRGTRCVFTRTTIKTGAQVVMEYYPSLESDATASCGTVGYANDFVIRSVAENGVSSNYMYVATAKTTVSISRLKVSGEKLYFTGCFSTVDTDGNFVSFSSLKWVCTTEGYHYFLLKTGKEFYIAKISALSTGGTVNSPEEITCYKLFTIDEKNALFATNVSELSTKVGIEEWIDNGFEYDPVNNIIYVPLVNQNNPSQSAILTYNLENVLSSQLLDDETDKETLVFPSKLSFLVNDSSENFEIESCGFRTGQGTAGDLQLYFNVNSTDAKEGIYSFSYTRDSGPFECVASDDSVVYSIEYNGNESTSGEMMSTNHICGIASSLNQNDYSKEGCTFAGWHMYRSSDGMWLYENADKSTGWYTEGKQPIGSQKYLASDMEIVNDLTAVDGDVITCYAAWTSDPADNTLFGGKPIDLGTEFYGLIKHSFSGLYVTNENGKLRGGEIVPDTTQYFRFLRQSDGSYNILSYSENMAWSVSDSAYIDGRRIEMSASQDEAAKQKFYIYYIGGRFYVRPASSTNSLNLDSVGTLSISAYNGDENAFEVFKCSFDGYTFPKDEFGSSFGAFIKNSASGKFMTADGDNIVFSDATYEDSQRWLVSRNEDGSYTMVSLLTGKAVEVVNGEMASGGNIDLGVESGNISQKFYFHKTSDGYTMIKPVYTSNVFDMDANNFDAHIYPYGEGSIQQAAQKFEIISSICNGAEPLYLGDEFKAYIGAPDSKMFTENGTSVYGGEASRTQGQLFTFVYDEKYEAYKIVGESGNAITVENRQDTNGAKLVMRASADDVSQRFYVYFKDGYYYMSPVFSNKIVDLASGDSTMLQIYGSGFTNRRQLTIEISQMISCKLMLKDGANCFVNDAFLMGIDEKTKASDVISQFDGDNVSIVDTQGNEISADDICGTGFRVCLTMDGVTFDSLTIVVMGDVDFNGVIDATDYLRMKQHFLKTFVMDDIACISGDMDNNGIIDSTDYMRIKAKFIG